MNIKLSDSSIKKGVNNCYGELSAHISNIVNSQPLSIFVSKQGENIEKRINVTDKDECNKENIVFNNSAFGESWKSLTHEEDVEIKRMAKLSRLGDIAAENEVYVRKMRKRFRKMNIVGKENNVGQSITESNENVEEYSYYDYEDDYDYEDYDVEDYDVDNDEVVDNDYDYDDYYDYDYDYEDEEWKGDVREIHVMNMKQ